MKTIGLVGPGRVGRTFAALLPPDRFNLGAVLASSWVSSKRAVRELRRGGAARGFEDFADCDWILIATPGDAFGTVCEDLLKSALKLDRKILLHTAAPGFDGATALLREQGAAVGRLYPINLFQRPSRSLAGVPFLIGGDLRALRAARALISTVGGEALRPSEAACAQAVAAASLLPNALFDLLNVVVGNMAAAGVPRKKAVAALSQLVDSTMRAYARSSRQVRRDASAQADAYHTAEQQPPLDPDESARVLSSLLRWTMEIHGYDPKKLAARAARDNSACGEREYEEAEAYAQAGAS